MVKTRRLQLHDYFMIPRDLKAFGFKIREIEK